MRRGLMHTAPTCNVDRKAARAVTVRPREPIVDVKKNDAPAPIAAPAPTASPKAKAAPMATVDQKVIDGLTGNDALKVIVGRTAIVLKARVRRRSPKRDRNDPAYSRGATADPPLDEASLAS